MGAQSKQSFIKSLHEYFMRACTEQLTDGNTWIGFFLTLTAGLRDTPTRKTRAQCHQNMTAEDHGTPALPWTLCGRISLHVHFTVIE